VQVYIWMVVLHCHMRVSLSPPEDREMPIQFRRLLIGYIHTMWTEHVMKNTDLLLTSLYSGWIRCGSIMVWYLLERVLRQFGYVQTIPRHAHHPAPPSIAAQQIDHWFFQFFDRVLTLPISIISVFINFF
jgi:hypothetical protein